MMRALSQCLALAAIALLAAVGASGRAAAPIRLPDVNGAIVRPLESKTAKAVCVFFIAHDCPISNVYAPEIGRIVRDYRPKGVTFYVVYTETDLTRAAARKHTRAYGFPCDALLDAKHALVRKAGATVTPEAALFAPDGRRLYLGRIDDLYRDYGQRRDQPSHHDLRLALDAALAGRPVPPPTAPPIGCFIPGT